MVYQFNVRFPNGELNLVVHIRDTADCVTVYNLTSIIVQSDSIFIDYFINNNLNQSTENPLTNLLSNANQNTIGQTLTSLSHQLNTMNNQSIEQALSSQIIQFN